MSGFGEPFGLVPDGFGAFVPDEARALMAGAAARRTGPFVMRSVPVRLTVADPRGPGPCDELCSRWLSAVKRVASSVDGMAGAGAPRPSRMDVTVFLWSSPKRLPSGERSIGPSHANTGVTSRDPSGRCSILVFRRQESVKTLVHEVLHAYGFGDWANGDPAVQAACRAFAARAGVSLPEATPLKPTEALVDAVAIRLACQLFGGAPWEACVSHAERLSSRLLRRCLDGGGGWAQSTAAFEYYCVKASLMRRMDDVLAAHLSGLHNPDKGRLRRLFRSLVPAAAGSEPVRGAVDMRMAPPRLAPPPHVRRAREGRRQTRPDDQR